MDINWVRGVNLKIKYVVCQLHSPINKIRLNGGHTMITFEYPILNYSHVQIILTDVVPPTLFNTINNINQDFVDKCLVNIFTKYEHPKMGYPIISFPAMQKIDKSSLLSLLNIPTNIQGFILLLNL